MIIIKAVMNINWEIIVTTLLLLLFIVAIVLVILSYIRYVRYWQAIPEPYIDNRACGKYFIRHVTQAEQLHHLGEYAKKLRHYHKTKTSHLFRILWAASGVFAICLLILGVSIGV